MFITKMKSVLILALFSGVVCAHELTVTDKHFTYNLVVEENVIRFKNVNSNISIDKAKCNTHIIERFRKQFDRYMKDTLAPASQDGSLKVKFDSLEGYVHKKGTRAKFLRSMPNQIQRLKIEEGLNCNPS